MTRQGFGWWSIPLVAGAVMLRLAGFDFLTDDVRNWVMPWYDHLHIHGFASLGADIPTQMDSAGNYTPPYYYLLLFATMFDGVVETLHLVKVISTIFDVLVAFGVYRLVAIGGGRASAVWASMAVLYAPTVIANGAWWGQADAVPAVFVIGAVYGAMIGRPALSALLLGAGLAIKATPAFLLPVLVMLAGRSAMRWRTFLWLPVGYVAMMAPALVAGRPIADLFVIYLHQGALYHHLSMNAPNLYYFVPDRYYEPVRFAGAVLAVAVALSLAALPAVRRASLTPRFLLLAASTFAVLMPFLLPKMHDRYFFTADLLTIALAFTDRRLWYLPILSQISSLLAYVPVLSEAYTGIDGGFAGVMPLAVIANTVLVALLVRLYWASSRESTLQAR